MFMYWTFFNKVFIIIINNKKEKNKEEDILNKKRSISMLMVQLYLFLHFITFFVVGRSSAFACILWSS